MPLASKHFLPLTALSGEKRLKENTKMGTVPK